MAILGKKKNEAEDKLVATKKLILKVKRMGMDTKEAEHLYLEAKSSLKNKKYAQAIAGLEDAKKSAKISYSISIKAMLEIKISQLDKKLDEMQNKNLNTVKITKLIKEAKSLQKRNVRENKLGLKAVKEGLRLSKSKISKFNRVSEYMSQTRSLVQKIEDYNPNIEIIIVYKEKLDEAQELINTGKINDAENLAKELHTKMKKENEKFKNARNSLDAFKKVISDANVLGTKFDSQTKLEHAQNMLLGGDFTSALEIADKATSEISPILQEYKEAKFHVDSAFNKVQDVKKWGFSTYEVQKILDSAKEALSNHDFEKAKAKSEECQENATNIKERHKQSLELIQKAKDEVKKIKSKGQDTTDFQNIISDAESEFNKGDYKATNDKLERVFEAISGLNQGI